MKWKITFIIICSCSHLAAQTFQYRTYSTKEGLSSNAASYAVKDDLGFLWIATGNGLNRFDGNAFDHFFNNPSNSNSIASNEINNLFIDSKKNLWVTTMAGLSLYHPHTQSFSNYAPDTLVLPKIGHLYPAIAEDEAGNIWLGGWYDLLLFDPAAKKFTSTGWAGFADKVKPADGNHSRVVVLAIRQKNSHEFWVMTTYGLFSVNKKTLQFTYYPYPGIKDYYGCQMNYVDENGIVWIGTYQNGILHYNPSTNQWKSYSTPVEYRLKPGWDWAYGITKYNGDTLVYGTQKGLVFLLKDQQAFTSNAFNSLPQDAYTCIVKDGAFNWLVSAAGLTKVFVTKKNFNLLHPDFIKKPGKLYPLQKDQLFILADDETGNVVIFDRQHNQHYNIKTSEGKEVKGNISFKMISNDMAILNTDKNLYHFNIKSAMATGISLPKKINDNNPCLLRNIVHNNAGTIWIRDRRQGIIEYKNNHTTYINICRTTAQTTFSSMYFDSSANLLWVGVENEGVYLYDPVSKTVTHHLFNIAPSQKGATITAIANGAKGIIYGCDINYGLFAFNSITKTFNRFTSYDGLISNNCNFICRDVTGNMWLSHSEGISRFDTASKTFSNYPELKEAANYAGFMSTDNNGNIYLPSPQGYYTWNAADFSIAALPGKLYLRNGSVAEKSLPVDSSYTFSCLQNNLSFQFGFLCFTNDQPVLLQYQLNNSEWHHLKNENTVSFSNLAPNHYLLNVREKNNPAQLLTIRFVISPPFYKSWWFLLLSALATAGIVLFVFKRRLFALKKQAALKQKIAETEMMALRAQMNPHFIFNCISSIDNFILDNDKDNASNYLNKFAKLIRNILDNSKNEVVPFWKDWETLKLYLELEQLRSNEKFSFAMEADETLLNGHYKIPPLIIQPYIENAIHHGLNPLTGKQGELLLRASLKENILEYCIEDNGIGRKKAAEKNSLSPSHQSYGMQLTKERIDLFNEQAGNTVSIKDRHDNEGAATGTTVTVLLKI
ncbi:MAG: histidine kinase [Chitinophagaceae bacterium]|nr:histidine kinase [Chitinophagaceae bacterium]